MTEEMHSGGKYSACPQDKGVITITVRVQQDSIRSHHVSQNSVQLQIPALLISVVFYFMSLGLVDHR